MMEIRPLPGQPGLFREGLGSTRWTSTVAGGSFRAPLGGRGWRRQLAGLGATAPAPEMKIVGAGWTHVIQEPVPSDQVAGLELTLYLLTPGPLVTQAALDNFVRLTLGQLGFDVGPSALEATPLVYTWNEDAGWYYARIAQGPKDLIALGRDYKVVANNAPTPNDLKGLPVTVERYSVLARPKDGTGVMDAAKLQAVIKALDPFTTQTLLAAMGNGDAAVETFLRVRGVPGPQFLTAGIGGWLGALALIGGAYLLHKERTTGGLRPIVMPAMKKAAPVDRGRTDSWVWAPGGKGIQW